MVYGSEEEWVTPVYSRFATGEQSHEPELGVGPIVDKFAEAFAKRTIYSIGDLYSNADTNRISLDVHATTRSDKLGRTYDECNEQGAPKLHSTDNDTIHR